MKKGDLKVMIGLVAGDMVHTDFAYSLAQLFAYTLGQGIACGINMTKCTLIDVARNNCVDEMLKTGCTHLCFIDSDMSFKPDVLVKLLQHETPLVGLTYSTRRPPFHLTHRNFSGSRTLLTDPLQVVESMGCGFILIERNVFESLPRPWFRFVWLDDKQIQGEDVTFCHDYNRVTEKYPFVDVNLSRDSIRHCGMHYYSVTDAENFVKTETEKQP